MLKKVLKNYKEFKKIYMTIIILLFILIISNANKSYAYTDEELEECVNNIHTLFEDNPSLYQDYFDSYILSFNNATEKISVYIYNSNNTKLLYYNDYLYFTYCFSENNLTNDNFYVKFSMYNLESNSLTFGSSGFYNLSNYLENTSGFYSYGLSLSTYDILYTDTDILSATSSTKKYVETLPFDINELEVYRTSDKNKEEPTESEEIENNVYDDTKLLENLREINENIFETNNILYSLIFVFCCWFIIDFLRHAFFNERR